MNARGVSALIACLLVFVAIIAIQPSPSQLVESYQPVSELAALSGTVTTGSSATDCKKSGSDTADGMCPEAVPGKTGYKAGAGKTFFDGSSLVDNLYGQSCSDQYVSGICCGPKSCLAQTCKGADGQFGNCAATNLQKAGATANAGATTGQANDANPPTVTPDKTGSASAQQTGTNSQSPSNSQAPQQTPGNTPIQQPPSTTQTTQQTPGNTPVQSAPAQSAAPAQSSGAGQGPVVSGTQPATPIFSGNPSLGNVTSPVSAGNNPLKPISPTPTQSQGSYSPTSPTFGRGGGYSVGYSPTVTASSPLTNFANSLASLNTFVDFVSSIFDAVATPAAIAPPTTIVNNEIVTRPSPTVTTVVAAQSQKYQQNQQNPQNTQISVDAFTGVNAQQNTSWLQQPSSYIDIITGGQQSISPVEIATIVQGSAQPNNPAQPLITQISSNSPIQSLLQPQQAQSLSNSSSINLQVPQVSSLAINTINGLENYQNVPEQFYIEEAQLAQAQSNYAWLQAQIAAWQNAETAGVCDNSCQNALSILQNEVPGQYQQVRDLQAQVNEGPAAFEATTSVAAAPTTTGGEVLLPTGNVQVPGAQVSQVVAPQSSALQAPVPSEGAPYYVKQNNQWCDQYGNCIPESSFQPEPVTQVVTNNPSFSGGSSANQAPVDPVAAIVQAVEGWVNNALSIFSPNTSTTTPSQSCSLFKSLFGGCGGS